MTVRLAAGCLIVLPLCASAGPLGVLTAPFASKVLIQQRQAAARQNQPVRHGTQAGANACQANDSHGARAAHAGDKQARCDGTGGKAVADGTAGAAVADGAAGAGKAVPVSDKKHRAD